MNDKNRKRVVRRRLEEFASRTGFALGFFDELASTNDEAKDIVQESFLRLWENREAVLGGKEKSYLFTVAYRLIVDRVRMGKRYTGDESVLRTSPAPGRPDYNGISELIDRFLDELPPLQKSLIMLRDYEGYSYREMAEMTRLSETQVKVYIFRARTALRRIIGDINNIL